MALNRNINIQNDSPNYQNVEMAEKSFPSPPRDVRYSGAFRLAGVCIGVMCIVQGTLNIVLRLYFSSQVDTSAMRCDNHTLFINLQQLQHRYDHLVNEKAQLEDNYTRLGRLRDQLWEQREELHKKLYIIGLHIKNPEWVSYRSSFYFLSTEKKKWTDGRVDCQKRGAALVVINSRQEQDFIELIRRGNSAWIGLTDQDKEGVWKWVDGTQLTSAYWWDQEPNDFAGNEDCVVTGYNHVGRHTTDIISTWNDISCTSTEFWICEKTFPFGGKYI